MTNTFVGMNFVMPEDGYISMRDYTLQMRMLEYLHAVYPKVRITLHAGELAPGLVPPEGLRFHIRQAVEIGHAERIGHGVDVMYEDDAPGLAEARWRRSTSWSRSTSPPTRASSAFVATASFPHLPRRSCARCAIHRR